MKKVLFLCAISAMMLSCKATYQTRTADTNTIGATMSDALVTADLDVAEVRAKASADAPRSKKVNLSVAQLEKNALGKLLEETRADVVVNPLYTYDYENGKLIKVTVTGYPAHYTHFRNVDIKEVQEFELEKIKAANQASPQIVIYGAEVNAKADDRPCPAKQAAPAPAPAPAREAAPAPAPRYEEPAYQAPQNQSRPAARQGNTRPNSNKSATRPNNKKK